MNKYKVLEIIGDGTYGTVYRGINTETNEKVAIKKLKSKVKSWQECIDMNEVRVLRNLQHENIIKLSEIIRDQNSDVSLVFEFADTNLFEYIDGFRKRNERIPEYKIKNIVYQIASGLNYLHQNGYMHRDLKPENILIMEDTNLIKLADFGVAKEIPNYKNSPLTDYVCTRWYRAPECVLKSTSYSAAIDVWALGCIMAELYALKPLFIGQNEFDQLNKITTILGTPNFNDWPEGFKLIQKLQMRFPICNRTNLSNLLPGIGVEGINLLTDIFSWDSSQRPNCSMIMQHRYFGDIRPGTYSHQTRFDAQNDFRRGCMYNNMNHHSNKNVSDFEHTKIEGSIPFINTSNPVTNYNIDINNHQQSNKDITSVNYLKKLNYQNYRDNNGLIPDINSLFNKDAFLNNNLFPYSYPNKYCNSTNNPYTKNKFSYMAEKDILSKKKKFNGQSAQFVPFFYDNKPHDYFNSNLFNSSSGEKSNFFNYPSLGRMNQYQNKVYL